MTCSSNFVPSATKKPYSRNILKSKKYTQEQYDILNAAYSRNNKKVVKEFDELAIQTGLLRTQVVNWFRYQRFKDNHNSRQNGSKICKKEIKIFTAYQKAILHGLLQQSEYPSLNEIQKNAKLLGLSVKEIRNWFRNQRKRCARASHLTNSAHNISALTPFQMIILNNMLKKHPDCRGLDYNNIVKLTGLTKGRVLNWFSSRRRTLNRNKN